MTANSAAAAILSKRRLVEEDVSFFSSYFEAVAMDDKSRYHFSKMLVQVVYSFSSIEASIIKGYISCRLSHGPT